MHVTASVYGDVVIGDVVSTLYGPGVVEAIRPRDQVTRRLFVLIEMMLLATRCAL